MIKPATKSERKILIKAFYVFLLGLATAILGEGWLKAVGGLTALGCLLLIACLGWVKLFESLEDHFDN